MSSLLKNLWRCLTKSATFWVLMLITPRPPPFDLHTIGHAALGFCFALISAPSRDEAFWIYQFDQSLFAAEEKCSCKKGWESWKYWIGNLYLPAWLRKVEVAASLLLQLQLAFFYTYSSGVRSQSPLALWELCTTTENMTCVRWPHVWLPHNMPIWNYGCKHSLVQPLASSRLNHLRIPVS